MLISLLFINFSISIIDLPAAVLVLVVVLLAVIVVVLAVLIVEEPDVCLSLLFINCIKELWCCLDIFNNLTSND